jgi:predicted  nucleic acid-binding Zn-ribbon protein
MSKIKKGIISPTEKSGPGYIFESSGKLFKLTGNVVEEADNASLDFLNLSKALKLFKVDESGIQFNYDYSSRSQVESLDEAKSLNYEKLLDLNSRSEFLNSKLKESKLEGKTVAVKELEGELDQVNEQIVTLNNKGIQVLFRYDADQDKTFIGNREVLTESITEEAFTSALIKYEDKSLLSIFESAAKNFSKLSILDFVTEITEGDIKISVIRTPNRSYVWRLNEATKIGKFMQMQPHELVDYVAEETGQDVSSSVQDLIDDIQEEVKEREETIDLKREMVSFLQDQKGRLAEANRNIPAIKEADHFLNSEINRINEEIKDLEEKKLDRNEGYVKAKLKVDTNGIEKGTEISVDAVEFAQAGKEDLLTIFVEEEPVRIEKRTIEMPSSELS